MTAPSASFIPDRSRILALGWAAFLACSWTWCIGMYLPVLLVRDYGVMGWLVFTLPNVIGAAAMGWVLYKPGAAADLARRHLSPAIAFSVVTIFFHAFFVGWIIRSLIGDAAEVITLAMAGAMFLFGRRGRRDLAVAAGLLFFSLLAFVVAASLHERSETGPTGIVAGVGLAWLSPVICFGFLLCPYLDLTFLRARASTEAYTGIAAFTVGFGVFFTAMLAFTLWYARFLQPATVTLHYVSPQLAWVIAAHMMLQSAFTVALHSRAIAERWRGKAQAGLLILAIALVIVFLAGVWGAGVSFGGHNAGELIYRLFMAFYGLVAPAYVWICMVPTRGGLAVSPRQKLLVTFAAVAVAAPMMWMGFIGDQMIWLAPGLAVVLLAKVMTLQPWGSRQRQVITITDIR